jgi:hypothetical protein
MQLLYDFINGTRSMTLYTCLAQTNALMIPGTRGTTLPNVIMDITHAIATDVISDMVYYCFETGLIIEY